MSDPVFIFDVHLDLSMNALEWNRDLRWSQERIRRWEQFMKDKVDRGNNTVCLPEMRRGRIGLCVATQIGRYSPYFHRLPGWNSPEQAWAQTQGQLAWYRIMEEAGELVQIRNRADKSVIWEGRAETEAPASAPAAQPGLAADKLAAALFKDFPGVSGQTVRVP